MNKPLIMERKIGEIFEYNGEWYQCLNGFKCYFCSFNESGNCDEFPCTGVERTDSTSVHFKKLEKYGEPYISSRNKKRYQLYRCFCLPIITKDRRIEIGDANWVGIEIKQKENMEEYKTPLPKEDNHLTRIVYAYVNGKISDKELIKSIKEMTDEYPYDKNELKPFSLEAAKAGKPVCTRDGRNVRIIAFDAKRKDKKNIITLVPSKDYPGFEDLIAYPNNGNYYEGHENDGDLMMLPEKKEGWVNVYKVDGRCNVGGLYSSKEEAEKQRDEDYIATVKINWEE